MRLGDKKRIYIKSNRMNPKKVSGFLIVLLFVSMTSTVVIYFFKIIQPLLLKLAEHQTKVIAEQTVQQAVHEIFKDIDYTEFIRFSRSEDGNISAVESDMMRVNQLQSQAAMAIQGAFYQIQETSIQIPWGSLTGNSLFAGLGPYLPVKVLPYGRTKVEFKSDLTEAGINQTHLQISLLAKSYVGIILPTGRMMSEVVTEMPVVQTVIVGKIPENYVNIDRMGEDYEGDVLDVIR